MWTISVLYSITKMKHFHLLTIILFLVVLIPAANTPTASHRPVCCATPDGLCKDIGIPFSQSGCGREHQDYTLISETIFCTNFDECFHGPCTIRGHVQPYFKEYYACVKLCVEVGACTCTNNEDLATCTGEFSWERGPPE